MRGRACSHAQLDNQGRITPAYAGKSPQLHHGQFAGWDHPRVCGEESFIRWLNETKGGITPAYAGKSIIQRHLSNISEDHPRVCGEEFLEVVQPIAEWGSPPRMRGRAVWKDIKQAEAGITPAYAGKRLKKFHSIGHFSCILCLFHSVLHRASASGGSRAGPCAPPCLPAQNAIPV